MLSPTENSFGIELNRNNISIANELFDRELVSHFQVTIPSSTLRPEDLDILNQNIPIIIHSNILNVAGKDNDFKYLERCASLINKLNPVHIIEHFTKFRDENGDKKAVSYCRDTDFGNCIENMEKWGKMLSCPILLENIPVTENVLKYYTDLFDVAAQIEKVKINIDVPHLLISLASISKDERILVKNLVKFNDIEGVHLGAIKVDKGYVVDSHQSLPNVCFKTIEKLHITSNYITLEQSESIPNSKLKELIVAIKLRKLKEVDFEILNYYKGLPHLEQNQKIIDSNVRAILKYLNLEISYEKKCEGQYLDKFEDVGRLLFVREFDKHYLFVSPFSILENKKVRFLKRGDRLKSLLKFLHLMRNLNLWFGENTNVSIRILMSGKVIKDILIGHEKNARQVLSVDYNKI